MLKIGSLKNKLGPKTAVFNNWHSIANVPVIKKIVMKTVLERLGVAGNVPLEKLRKTTAILMILFLLVFGAASLFILINSAA